MADSKRKISIAEIILPRRTAASRSQARKKKSWMRRSTMRRPSMGRRLIHTCEINCTWCWRTRS